LKWALTADAIGDAGAARHSPAVRPSSSTPGPRAGQRVHGWCETRSGPPSHDQGVTDTHLRAAPGVIPTGPAHFSFVTLATLGHGDITPATPLSEWLAVQGAIVGRLCTAVVVAHLVATYPAHRRESAQRPRGPELRVPRHADDHPRSGARFAPRAGLSIRATGLTSRAGSGSLGAALGGLERAEVPLGNSDCGGLS
jgi:hypothetical protein